MLFSLFTTGAKKSKKKKRSSSSDSSSRISTAHMEAIVTKLISMQHRSSTAKNYLAVWRKFNKFVIELDRKPKLWEDCTTLFIGYLIDNGMQSSTIKSYVSAIKKTLIMDGYDWNDSLLQVRSLTRACRLINDMVRTRLPIQCGLLEMILFEVQRIFTNKKQLYLELLYKTLFAMAYYGLMRIGEITDSPHVLLAKNVHIAKNKDKLMLVLYSSKTHDKSNKPQKIKLSANIYERTGHYVKKHFCPFTLARQFINIRGDYLVESEQFFIFRDRMPVTANYARNVLKNALLNLGLDNSLYGMHSFRIGRTTDLIRFGYSIEEVKLIG